MHKNLNKSTDAPLKLKENLPILLNTIQISFLSENMKKKYLILLNRCAEKLQIS